MSVEDIDLDVDLSEVEGGDSRYINEGRYLMKLTKMDVQETKKGKCFLYQAETVDTQVEKNEECIGRTVYEIINIDSDSKQLWRLKELLGGAFGIGDGKKIPGHILGKHFTALVYIDAYQGNENTKIKGHRPAPGWEGMTAVVDDDGSVTSTSKTKKKSKASAPKSNPDDSSGPEDDDIEF